MIAWKHQVMVAQWFFSQAGCSMVSELNFKLCAACIRMPGSADYLANRKKGLIEPLVEPAQPPTNMRRRRATWAA